jgi:hypothetical protein
MAELFRANIEAYRFWLCAWVITVTPRVSRVVSVRGAGLAS